MSEALSIPGVEIQLFANMARLAQDMAQAKTIVGSATRDIERMAGLAKTALGAIGVGLSVAGIVAFAQKIVDATSKFKDLGVEAGVTAAEISRFEEPARKAGSSAEFVAGAIFKMSKAAMDARDPQSRAAQAFTAIGISIDQVKKLKPDELFELTARQLAKYSDGQQKNAVIMELWNKGGREGARVAQEIAEKAKLVATVTNEDAEAADRFNDQMVELHMTSEKAWRAIAAAALPAMNSILKAFIDGKREAGLYQAAINAVAEALNQIGVGADPATRLATLNREIAHTEQLLREREAISPDGFGGFEITTDANVAADLERMKKMREGLESFLHAEGMAEQTARALAERKNGAPGFDPEADKQGKIGLDLLVHLREEYAKLNNQTQQDVNLQRTLLELEKDSYKNITPARKQEIIDQAKLNDELEKRLRTEQFLAELNKLELDAAEARGKAVEELSNNWADATEQMEQEAKLLGLSNVDREKAILLEKARLDIVAAGNNAAAVRDINENLAKQLVLLDKINGAQQSLNVWSQLAGYAGEFANALTHGVGDAITYLRNLWKQLASEMIAILAKKWILQLGASITGSAALSSAAGQVGQGTVGGAVGNMIGGAGTALGGAYGAGEGFMMGFSSGVAGPTAGLMEQGGAFLASMGPIGWAALAVLAIAAVATAFRDKGENWKAQFGFGSNAHAYVTQGVFGPEGFEHIAGDDALNKQIAAFMASTGAIDKIIAGTISSETIARITANLAGPYLTRNDGQPSEFAFGKGDDNAGPALTLEYLQKKYGTVFDEIDKTFADFIRGYTGKAEDLVKEISAFASLLQSLQRMGIKGLDIAALRAMQRDGEQIGDTFKRIGDGWAYFVENFTSDADKFEMVKSMVSGVFDDLGIAMPTTMQGFADLVKGLDLTTEAGRNAFQALLAVAPAFQSVAQAAQAATDAFNAIAGQLSPSFGAANSRDALVEAVNAWRALSPNNSASSVDETIANIANLIANDQLGAARDFARTIPGGLDALTRMLLAFKNWQGPSSSGAGAGPAGGSMGGIAPPWDGKNWQAYYDKYGAEAFALAAKAAEQLAAGLDGAKENLKAWVNGAQINPSISPLTPAARLQEARAQYEAQLALAKAGDVGAISGLGGFAQTYLEIARSIFASSAVYNEIFRSVIEQTGGIAGMSTAELNAKLYSVLPVNSTLMSEATGSSIVNRLDDILAMFAAGDAKVKAPEVEEALGGVAEQAQGARGGFLNQ